MNRREKLKEALDGSGEKGRRIRQFKGVALVIQHAWRMFRIFFGLSGTTTFFDIISQRARLSKTSY
jgi:hypothetical protein